MKRIMFGIAILMILIFAISTQAQELPEPISPANLYEVSARICWGSFAPGSEVWIDIPLIEWHVEIGTPAGHSYSCKLGVQTWEAVEDINLPSSNKKIVLEFNLTKEMIPAGINIPFYRLQIRKRGLDIGTGQPYTDWLDSERSYWVKVNAINGSGIPSNKK